MQLRKRGKPLNCWLVTPQVKDDAGVLQQNSTFKSVYVFMPLPRRIEEVLKFSFDKMYSSSH